MEVKLGQLPEARRLTHSYQKHRCLHRFKETLCECDSLTFRCRLSLPSTFCHQQLETHIPLPAVQPAYLLSFLCSQDVGFSSAGNVFLIIYSAFMYHKDICFISNRW